MRGGGWRVGVGLDGGLWRGRGLVCVLGRGGKGGGGRGREGKGGDGERGERGGRTFVRVVGGHEEGSVDFQTPAAALDGA